MSGAATHDSSQRLREGKWSKGTDLRKRKKGQRQWHMNHFDRLDGEAVGSDTGPSNFPALTNRKIAHMEGEFRWMFLTLSKPREPWSTAPCFPCALTAKLNLPAGCPWPELDFAGPRRPGDGLGAGKLNRPRLWEHCIAQSQIFRGCGGNWQNLRKCNMTDWSSAFSLRVSPVLTATCKYFFSQRQLKKIFNGLFSIFWHKNGDIPDFLLSKFFTLYFFINSKNTP